MNKKVPKLFSSFKDLFYWEKKIRVSLTESAVMQVLPLTTVLWALTVFLASSNFFPRMQDGFINLQQEHLKDTKVASSGHIRDSRAGRSIAKVPLRMAVPSRTTSHCYSQCLPSGTGDQVMENCLPSKHRWTVTVSQCVV